VQWVLVIFATGEAAVEVLALPNIVSMFLLAIYSMHVLEKKQPPVFLLSSSQQQ
jgi:hypothetical protein